MAKLPVIDSNRYRILHPLDRGGICRVYVADDEELNREVAPEQLRRRYADDSQSRSRLLFEAEVTAGLEHPGVGPVYGLGQYADGRRSSRCGSSGAATSAERSSQALPPDRSTGGGRRGCIRGSIRTYCRSTAVAVHTQAVNYVHYNSATG